MNWTSEKPTVAGWYWHKRTDGTVTVHEVVNSFDRLWINLSQYGVLDKILVSNVTAGEWLGPITPDSYQQGRVAGLVRGAQLVRWHKSCAFEADPAFALERAAKDIESVASQIIQPQQAQEGGVGDGKDCL